MGTLSLTQDPGSSTSSLPVCFSDLSPIASDSLQLPQLVHSLPAYYSTDFALFQGNIINRFLSLCFDGSTVVAAVVKGDVGGKLPYLSVSSSSRAVGMVDVGGEEVDDTWK